MTLKQQKIFSAVSVAVSIVGSLEALAYILNLNQAIVFIHLSFWIYLYLAIKMTFLYDLHFKNRGALLRARAKHENVEQWFLRNLKVCLTTIWYRLRHLSQWNFLKHFQFYLILPTVIFWSTVALLSLNFGKVFYQQLFILLSSGALILNFWYLKEIFHRNKERVDADIFNALSAVKMYSTFVVFSAVLGLVRYYCLPSYTVFLGVFSLTALLTFQALFQFGEIKLKNMIEALGTALFIGIVGFIANLYWAYNYFTFGALLMAGYNLAWGLYHHKMEKTLTPRVLIELLLITALIVFMLISVTNFKERIMYAC